MSRIAFFRRLGGVLVIIAALLLGCVPASANSWGLQGKLLNAVMADSTWDDYTALSSQAEDYAVMHARYHNALFFVDGEKQLHVYTRAVYQPEDKAKDLKLTWKEEVLTLSYGAGEVYRFSDGDGDGKTELLEARIGDFHVWRDDMGVYSYYAEDRDGRVAFRGWNPLSAFNIRLFPRSTAEVRRIHLLTAYLGDTHEIDSGDADAPGVLIRPGKKGTAPVYAAPFGKSAWRAAKGKAAVGLNGDIRVLDDWRNADGESYTMVQYSVSERTRRVGWTLSRDLGREEKKEQEHSPLEDFCRVDVRAAADTYLTDDPDVSQFEQFGVPEGTCFTCLGTWGADYAYVEAEVKNGRFTDGGAVVWGFVPLRDLEIMDPGEELPEAAERLAGTWAFEAGGSFGPDVIAFAEDGTYTSNLVEQVHDPDGNLADSAVSGGTWKVIACKPMWNLFWNEPEYALLCVGDNGGASLCGLSFDGEGFGLTGGEGGAGYIPADPARLEELEVPGEDGPEANG